MLITLQGCYLPWLRTLGLSNNKMTHMGSLHYQGAQLEFKY